MPIKDALKRSNVLNRLHKRLTTMGLRARVHLTNLAVDFRIRPAGRSYTRFVIVSRGRSGTNLLKGLLNDHPGAICFGELFRRYGHVKLAVRGHNASPRDDQQISDAPIQFLNRRIYRRWPSSIHAVGFKIFYYHARNPEWKHVWDYLRNEPDLKVIHLRRENMLATHLSLVRATRNKVWQTRSYTRRTEPEPTYLDYDDCLRFFEGTRDYRAWAEEYFANSPTLDISYEALSANRDSEMMKVFEFLNLEHTHVQPSNVKQRRSPLSVSIANFDELRHRFAGTEWARFFDM